MKCKYKKVLEALGLRPRTPPPRIFVSLNVFNAYRPPGFSQPSTRVIIRISIWTLLVSLLTFMIVYTTLLVYLDSTLIQQSSPFRSYGRHRKIKLTGRHKMHMSTVNESVTDDMDSLHRKVVWNTSAFYSDIKLPQCLWQVVFRVLITSRPKSKTQRQAIRNTWCNPGSFGEAVNKWHCIFLVGMSQEERLNAEVRKEKEDYNDMLIGNYFDSYENITLKVIHGFNWSVNYCPSLFLIKTDEDCFVNSQLLHNFLLNSNDMTHDLYAGMINKDKHKLKVVRDQYQKWYVPVDDFPRKYYYPYASGMGYIVSIDVAQRVVKESTFIKPIVNEDAYIGIVMHSLGIIPTHSARFVLSSSGLRTCNFMYVFIVHDVMPNQQEELLETVIKTSQECKGKKIIDTWS